MRHCPLARGELQKNIGQRSHPTLGCSASTQNPTLESGSLAGPLLMLQGCFRGRQPLRRPCSALPCTPRQVSTYMTTQTHIGFGQPCPWAGTCTRRRQSAQSHPGLLLYFRERPSDPPLPQPCHHNFWLSASAQKIALGNSGFNRESGRDFVVLAAVRSIDLCRASCPDIIVQSARQSKSKAGGRIVETSPRSAADQLQPSECSLGLSTLLSLDSPGDGLRSDYVLSPRRHGLVWAVLPMQRNPGVRATR